jgi:hypothetical protein
MISRSLLAADQFSKGGPCIHNEEKSSEKPPNCPTPDHPEQEIPLRQKSGIASGQDESSATRIACVAARGSKPTTFVPVKAATVSSRPRTVEEGLGP